jgi:predicted flap endonuclease-1-like 5' DNA nuclease
MGAWVILIVIIVVILMVWWALLRNVKNYKPDFDVHSHEEHAETAHGETGFGDMDTAERSLVAQETAAQTAAAQTAAAHAGVYDASAAPAAAAPDDLAILEGIGPKINELLHANGIHTYADLAAADVTGLREILEANALRFIDPTTWPEQARLAAAGRMDELQAYTATLRGGRNIG